MRKVIGLIILVFNVALAYGQLLPQETPKDNSDVHFSDFATNTNTSNANDSETPEHNTLSSNFFYSDYKDNVAPTIKFGYSAFFIDGYSQLFEIGYYHMMDFSFMSAGPSFSVLGMLRNNKFIVGPKIGFEANLFIFDAKLDVSYLHPGVYIRPSIGLSLFSMFGVTFGFNTCINQKKSSGFTLGLYYHFSPMREHIK